ncbi:MAG TPA: hypothetical protein DEB40_13525 [Elusimicrobia bacterium]|nr:hypothetical protein [Elusimicrobiota bacterium]HBT62754.1 hypothetical protein [Elusimicrobiota bacterium]
MSVWQAFLAGVALSAAAMTALGLFLDSRRNRLMGRFFSHAAHEINTPITAINITVLNLLGGIFGELPPEQAKWIEMMREQVYRLNGMVGELRDIIHIMVSRDFALNPESVAPAELAAGALAAIRRGVDQSNVEVKLEVPTDLPRVRVDQGRTVRTLTSLIFHARKFRSGGDLLISGQHADGKVFLRLHYQGLALPPGEAERSLELFYPARKGKSHTLNAVGLGLGVLRAVARHQGADLTFEVQPDGQSVLSLALPVSPR